MRTLKGHAEYVRSVAFSPDGKLVASGSDDRRVKIWDAATGAEVNTDVGGEVMGVFLRGVHGCIVLEVV